MKIKEFKVKPSDEGKRLDRYLSDKINDLSRTYLKKLVDIKKVTVNQLNCKASYKLSLGDEVRVIIPEASEATIVAQDIDINIIFEDDDILIVDKPQGMIVHPAPGNYRDTLVNALLFHVDNLSNINGRLRPGIVHRIDKDTSGLLLVAKNNEAHKSLATQLKDYSIDRRYITLVKGVVEEESAIIDAPIGRDQIDRKKMAVTDKNSKSATTQFKVLERFAEHSLVECCLKTGRTHQIRVHMSFIGHPIVGDSTYGYRKQKLYSNGQLLHAFLLGFVHPTTNRYMEFTSKLPEYFNEILRKLSRYQ